MRKTFLFAGMIAAVLAVALCDLPPALSLYRTAEQLEQNITALTQLHPTFTHESCGADPGIKYLSMGGEGSYTAIISCNVHAHELITGELCVDLANTLAAETAFLSRTRLILIYAANSNREVALRGDYCLRTNQNGIDPNRNFPVGFTKTSGETYGGEQPLSEGFSQCLEELAGKLHPLVYLDIHSGEFSLVFYQQPGDPVSDPSEPLLQQLGERFCRNCRVVDVAGLNTNGQAFQYMKYGQGVKYSSLIEIYGAFKAGLPTNDLCLTIFNPLSAEQLHFYRKKWVRAILGYFQLVERAEGFDGE